MKYKIKVLNRYLKLINSKQKKYFYFISFAQIILILLDIVFVASMGFLGSLLTSYISGKPIGNRVQNLLKLLSLDDSSIKIQLLYLTGICTISILIRLVSSIYLQNLIFQFISKVSSELTQKVYQSYSDSRAIRFTQFSREEIIVATLSNVDTLVVNFFGSLTFLISDLFLVVII